MWPSARRKAPTRARGREPTARPADPGLIATRNVGARRVDTSPSAGSLDPTALSRSPARWDRLGALCLAAGLLALYGPTYWDCLFGYWSRDSQGHELLVLAVCGWLFYRRRRELLALPGPGRPWIATLLLAIGLLASGSWRYGKLLPVSTQIEMATPFLVLPALLLGI